MMVSWNSSERREFTSEAAAAFQALQSIGANGSELRSDQLWASLASEPTPRRQWDMRTGIRQFAREPLHHTPENPFAQTTVAVRTGDDQHHVVVEGELEEFVADLTVAAVNGLALNIRIDPWD